MSGIEASRVLDGVFKLFSVSAFATGPEATTVPVDELDACPSPSDPPHRSLDAIARGCTYRFFSVALAVLPPTTFVPAVRFRGLAGSAMRVEATLARRTPG